MYLSPLVDVNEIDLTTTIPAVATSIGVIVVRDTWKGPELKVQLVNNIDELIEIFGKPEEAVDNEHGQSYEDLIAATGFLQYGNNLYCTRVLSPSATFAGVYGTMDVLGASTSSSSSSTSTSSSSSSTSNSSSSSSAQSYSQFFDYVFGLSDNPPSGTDIWQVAGAGEYKTESGGFEWESRVGGNYLYVDNLLGDGVIDDFPQKIKIRVNFNTSSRYFETIELRDGQGNTIKQITGSPTIPISGGPGSNAYYKIFDIDYNPNGDLTLPADRSLMRLEQMRFIDTIGPTQFILKEIYYWDDDGSSSSYSSSSTSTAP
jgi:hypothetical protein